MEYVVNNKYKAYCHNKNASFKSRRRPDFWVRIRAVSMMAGWALLLVFLFLMDFVKTKIGFFDNNFYNLSMLGIWSKEITNYMLIIMATALTTSIIGLFINSKRNKRRSDKFPFSLLFIGGISSAGIILFYIFVIKS